MGSSQSGRLGRLAHFTARYRWPVIAAWIVLTLFGGYAAGKLSSRWYQSLAVPGQAGLRGRASGRSRRSEPACGRRTSSSSTPRASTSRKSPAVRAAMARVVEGKPRRAHELVLLDRQPDVRVARPAHDVPAGVPARPSRARREERRREDPRRGGSRASGRHHRRRDRVRDALEEATTHGSSGGSSVLLEALIGGLGALVILLFVFGTLPAVLMPLVVAVASILNTFTLVWALTYITDVSIIVQFLIALVGLGVAIDYALLMIFRFRDELREGNDVESALVETMTHAGHSVIVSGTTVAVGLLAMFVLPLPLLRSMGIGGMLIPVVSVLATLTLLPAMLAVLGPTDQQRPGDAAALHRPRPSRRRRLGPLGALRAPAPGRGRGCRPGDRRRARGPRNAAEPERGAAEELPRHRHGDRGSRPARRGRDQPRRDEAAQRPRRERRQRASRSRRS